MPVVGCAADDGVNVFLLDEIEEAGVFVGLGPVLFRIGEVRFVDIADGDDFGAQARGVLGIACALSAAADESDGEAFAWSRGLGFDGSRSGFRRVGGEGRERGGSGDGGGGFKETSACG